jgi:hypothetical protein
MTGNLELIMRAWRRRVFFERLAGVCLIASLFGLIAAVVSLDRSMAQFCTGGVARFDWSGPHE